MYVRDSDGPTGKERQAAAMAELERIGLPPAPSAERAQQGGDVVEDALKELIRDAFGTNESQTELVYTAIGAVKSALEAAETLRSGAVKPKDAFDALSTALKPMPALGPPFKISPAELISTPLLALTVFLVQQNFLLLSGRGEDLRTEARFRDAVLTQMAESTNLVPPSINAWVERLGARLQQVWHDVQQAGSRARDRGGIYRDGAIDRMRADARDTSRAGDFPRSEQTGRTA